ncbi:TPA: tape measure protein [Citrobacter freundii]|uniref:tape measure protein n=1 Tax=Citrobacter freundii TaxID=546 RepID=UPI000EF17EF1|nr:phage tail tape measure protein [Citrobacter freundii]HEE0040108.1 tape measure protein [Citrobacter freundii]HEE9924376.1 tape measure protein [Citrobacter freundii]
MASSEQVGNIVYQVQMDVAELIEAQRKVNDRLDKMGSNFDRASGAASRFEGALNKVGVAIASAFTIDAAKRLIAIGDEMVTLEARIARLSPSIDAARETMKTLSAIASQTGNSLSETERLWESLTTSLKETGATNSQILKLTSTLQQIGTIGGASTEEMANALRQFGQSISGGIVRAEEFNSILEQMPELARQIASGLGISIGDLRQRMLEGKLTAQDALNAIQKQSQSVNEEFDKMPVSIDRAKNSLDVAFRNAINDLNQAIGLTSTLAGLMQNVADNLNYYNNNVGDSSRMPKLIKLQQDLNDEIKDGQRWYESDTIFQQRRAQAAFQLKQVEGEIAHIRAKAQKDAGNNQFSKPSTKGDDAATTKLVQNSERRLALAKLEGEARVRLQAQYDAADAGVTDQSKIKALQDEYAETYRITEARKESIKATKDGEAASKRSAAAEESVAQKISKLRAESDLTTESIEKRRIQEAGLRAQQSLGSSATKQQIEEARAIGEANEKAAIAMQKRKEASQNFTHLQGAASPVAAVDNQFQLQMEQLNEYATLYPQKIAQVEATRAAIEQQYRTQRTEAMWQEWSQQNAATEAASAAFTAFGNNASNVLTGIITGSMSASDALRSIGSTVLNSVINTFVQMGMEWVKSAIMGQAAQTAAIGTVTAVQTAATGVQTATSVAAAGTVAAAWTPAAILSSIASMGTAAAIGLGAVAGVIGANLLGKRKNGGPVSAGGMYQVGEGGMPEIYQASTGKQYMIPGDNGRVISNKDMQGGGGINVVLNIQNYNGSSVDAQASSDGNGGVTVDVIVADLNNGGPISNAITSNMNVKRTPRGQG